MELGYKWPQPFWGARQNSGESVAVWSWRLQNLSLLISSRDNSTVFPPDDKSRLRTKFWSGLHEEKMRVELRHLIDSGASYEKKSCRKILHTRNTKKPGSFFTPNWCSCSRIYFEISWKEGSGSRSIHTAKDGDQVDSCRTKEGVHKQLLLQLYERVFETYAASVSNMAITRRTALSTSKTFRYGTT